jgi:hypothetical protein
MGVSARYREIFFTLTKSVQKNPHKFSRLHPNPWNGTEVAFCLSQKFDAPFGASLKENQKEGGGDSHGG